MANLINICLLQCTDTTTAPPVEYYTAAANRTKPLFYTSNDDSNSVSSNQSCYSTPKRQPIKSSLDITSRLKQSLAEGMVQRRNRIRNEKLEKRRTMKQAPAVDTEDSSTIPITTANEAASNETSNAGEVSDSWSYLSIDDTEDPFSIAWKSETWTDGEISFID